MFAKDKIKIPFAKIPFYQDWSCLEEQKLEQERKEKIKKLEQEILTALAKENIKCKKIH